MRKSLRRIRGAIGMGLTWGAAWSAAGIMLAVVTRFKADAPFPLIFGVLGFIAGVIFSAILALTEGRRRFDQMSLPRFAVWGATGGLLLSAVFAKAASLGWGDVLAIAPTFAVACAVCASGSLAVARRAGPRELPDIRGDIAAAELTDHETRKRI
jgi:peptidoglycan/LPS O-acetylase OafA/YrhL